MRAGDELLSVIRPNGTGWTQHFIHKDGLGSVRTITDNEGNIVDTRGYEAFGTKNSEAGSEPLAYGFAGEAFDSTTHLAYHRARWMDSRVGRFTGMDKVQQERKNLYSHASNDPADRFDPSGNDDVAEQMNFFNFVGIVNPSGKCAVTSFDAQYSTISKPPAWWRLNATTFQEEADFTLALTYPSNRADCLIDQYRSGTRSEGGTVTDTTDGRYISDSPIGARYWWHTFQWNPGIQTGGSWNTVNGADVATWADAPGWDFAFSAEYPLNLTQSFVTRASDWVTGRVVASISWQVTLNAPSPNSQWTATGVTTGKFP